ncbi:MAG TPA: ImuA protein [Xanthobacteraceae bacterium]
MAATETLRHLRHTVAEIEATAPTLAGEQALNLGVAALDETLGGGLAFGALHELAPSAPVHAGAAAGFALALAARMPGRPVLWIQSEFTQAELGVPYGCGLALFGLSLDRLVVLTVAHASDALWAMEEALHSRAAVIGEVPDDRALDEGPATRRLSLAAREGGLGLILRPHPSPAASAAMTRWQIAAAPGLRDPLGGLGRTAFALSLTKNRRGPCGRWLIAWDHHEHMFLPALSVGVAEEACERPARAPLVHAG